MWHALLAPEIENGNQRTFLAIFHLTRKSVFWPLWVGGVPERGGNMGKYLERGNEKQHSSVTFWSFSTFLAGAKEI